MFSRNDKSMKKSCFNITHLHVWRKISVCLKSDQLTSKVLIIQEGGSNVVNVSHQNLDSDDTGIDRTSVAHDRVIRLIIVCQDVEVVDALALAVEMLGRIQTAVLTPHPELSTLVTS